MHGGRNFDDKREQLPDKRPPGRPPTHGRYSKYLKASLLDKIEEFENDKMFLDLRGEIALIRSLTARLLEKDNTDGESMKMLLDLVEETKKLASAYMAIEKDRKFALSHEEVIRILKEIAKILDKHIGDEVLLQLIVKDIEGIRI